MAVVVPLEVLIWTRALLGDEAASGLLSAVGSVWSSGVDIALAAVIQTTNLILPPLCSFARTSLLGWCF